MIPSWSTPDNPSIDNWVISSTSCLHVECISFQFDEAWLEFDGQYMYQLVIFFLNASDFIYCTIVLKYFTIEVIYTWWS